jgi:hypothetical protein
MAMQVLSTGITFAATLMLALEFLIWLRLAIPLSLFGFGCVFDVIAWCVGHCKCCHLKLRIKSVECGVMCQVQAPDGRERLSNASCPGPETNGVKSGRRIHQMLYQFIKRGSDPLCMCDGDSEGWQMDGG